MTMRPLNYYLTKTNRVTGWGLLGMISVYLCTGFAMCGVLGFDRLIVKERALALHKNLIWPLVAFFLAHAVISIYFAMRR
jgi:hypothetical protein